MMRYLSVFLVFAAAAAAAADVDVLCIYYPEWHR